MMLHAHWRGYLPSRSFLAQQPSCFRQPATGNPHPIDGSSSEIRAKNVEQNSAFAGTQLPTLIGRLHGANRPFARLVFGAATLRSTNVCS